MKEKSINRFHDLCSTIKKNGDEKRMIFLEKIEAVFEQDYDAILILFIFLYTDNVHDQ